ncbi:hypothetical protein PR202_gb06413 [Eleusine coracana subsp. coracana]|uniref:Uncharacterized protein n=1 Tax=Eleusine coracana subsp. coracana TaxID=191504 RepID=A0AAV5E9L0_ELECO|nr:hypothetical protein PR202_gb06413 [Eleusine coracana subsp. coracana]
MDSCFAELGSVPSKKPKYDCVLPASKWSQEKDISDDEDKKCGRGLDLSFSSGGNTVGTLGKADTAEVLMKHIIQIRLLMKSKEITSLERKVRLDDAQNYPRKRRRNQSRSRSPPKSQEREREHNRNRDRSRSNDVVRDRGYVIKVQAGGGTTTATEAETGKRTEERAGGD